MVDYNFYGHFSVGVSFVTLALWWNVNIFRNYYLSKCKNGPTYTSRVWYPGPFFKHFPVELGFIIFFCTIWMILFLARIQPGNHPHNSVVVQHEVVLSTYIIYAIVNLLKYKQLPIPNGIESVTMILMFLANAFLFYQHLQGKDPLNLRLHKILMFLYLACALTVFMEAQHCHAAIFSLLRSWTVQVLGTWYIQTAFILFSSNFYDPVQSNNAYDTHKLNLIIFLHCYGNALMIFGAGVLSFYWMRNRNLIIISENNWHANIHRKALTSDINTSEDSLLNRLPNLSA